MSEDETLGEAGDYLEDAAVELFQKAILVVGGVLLGLGLGFLGTEIEPMLGIAVDISPFEMLAAMVFIGMGAGRYWGKIMSLRALRPDFFYGGIFSTLFYYSWVAAPDKALIPALFTSGIIAMHMSRAVDEELSSYGTFFEKSSKAGLVLLGLWVFVYPVVIDYFPFVTQYIPF